MKKLLTFCIVFITAVYLFGFSVRAHNYEPVNAEIDVEVKLGGSVVIEPGENCPVPEKTILDIKDGETGRFETDFTSVGVYEYTVRMIPDDRDLIFDDTVYRVSIYVDDVDGRLVLTYVITKGSYKYGADSKCLIFVNTAPKPDKPPSGPKTNDDPGMKIFIIFVMIVSAVTLALSVILNGRRKRR